MVDKKIINITVKQMEDVKLNCTLQGGGVTWKQGDGSEIILSNRIKIVNNLLIISNASLQDAGEYVCSKMTPQGIVSYQVNLGVNVTINVYMALRILNWNFIKAYENESSPEYKNFTNHFKHQMDIVYKDLGGYIGVEILKIFNGSLRMRFRVIVVVTVKNKVDSVTGMKVRVTQKVVIRARNGWVESLQVDKDPKYMELYQSPPPPPENVTVVETLKDGAEVAWDLPLFHEYYFIKGYFIEYWKFSSETKERTRTLLGKRTKLTDLESDTAYAARVVAENINGIRGEESQQIDIKTKSGIPNWLLAVVIICVIFLIVVLTGIIVYCRRKKSRKNAMENFTMEAIRKEEAVEYVQPKSYVNNMFVNEKCQNFPREDLVLLEELGSGEFGVVFKGQLLEKGESKECAVKTLKGQADPEDYRELYQELEIMANIGHHPNLVNLIGSCIENEKLFVIVEFARYGSLIDFLRKARTDSEKKSEFELNYFNRLKIALNVAKGMSYLAQKRCVHRDLAARNVLLADNFVAKVADFGLSRDIYETGEYEKTTGGKLPTRWMAIESLELRRFTLQSDVWSFGVLLWEIETKGLMPHGAIAYIELLEKQKKGYRLEQPNGTPDELYHLMQMCWQANPRQRPTFPKICDTLEIMLNNNRVPNRTEPEKLNGNCSSNDCKSVHFLNPEKHLNCTDVSNVTHICSYTNYTPEELGVKVPGPNNVRYYRIPDKNMNASSNQQDASRARIGMKEIGEFQAAWCAALSDSDKWLEVNFDMPVNIEKIEVKRHPTDQNRWVESFYLQYKNSSGRSLVPYNNNSTFNSSQNGSCHYVFINQATKLRIYSNSLSNRTCLQLAVYGKPLAATPPSKVVPVEPTDKYKNLDSDSIATDEFLKGYLLWVIFIAFLVFLVSFTLTLLFCWCCRRAKPLKTAMEKSKEANPYYVPAWRRIDEKAEKGYIAAQETQEVKIAFTDEYIPPGLQKEKQDPNDGKFYRQKIFSFSRDQREDTKTSQEQHTDSRRK